MPQYQAPVPTPTWAEAGDALVSQPVPSQLASGFRLNERPTPNSLNWMLRQLARGYQYLAQGVNATLLGSVQEVDWRLLGGGSWSFNATTGVLAWSEPFVVAMPGLTDAANTGAAGSVTLSAGQLAYANCNAPFSTTGTLTSGSKTVSDLAFESGITVNATVTGPGVPAGATVVAISTTDSTITLSAAATASSAKTPLVFATSGPLTVTAADTASFAPSSNTVVLARCVAVTDMPNHVVVGVNAGVMLLRDGEQKRLLATGYVSTFTAPAGVDMPARTPVYITPGATRDANRTAGAAYPVEAAATAVRAAFAGITVSSVVAGSRVEIVSVGRLNYPAANFVPGLTYYADPATSGSMTATAATGAGQFIVPVGVAVTASMLLVAPGAPPVQTPASFAYKSRVELGRYFSRNAGGNAYAPLSDIYFDTSLTQGTTTVIQLQTGAPMTHPGSIVALSARASTAINQVTTVQLLKNGLQVTTIGVALPASATSQVTPIAKGTLNFVAGDVLSGAVLFGNGNASNLNIALNVAVTVELTP